MGAKAKQIAEVDLRKLVEELNNALADEWKAYYQYWYTALVVKGIYSEDVSEVFKKTGEQEFEHASEIANRLIELGETPVALFGDLTKKGTCAFPIPPKNLNDVKTFIENAIKGEGCAIGVYDKIIKMTRGKDEVTYQLISHILAEEVAHEEAFETLAGK